MSSYATFRLGAVEYGHIRNEVDDEVLAVFTDDMVVRRRVRARDHYSWWREDNPSDEESAAHDFEMESVRLVGPGPVISTRLDLMGITEHEVRMLLEEALRQEAAWLAERPTGDLSPSVEVPLTFAEWRDVVRDVDAASWSKRPFESSGSAGRLLSVLDGWEWRHVLRLLLAVWPDDEVELDLTELADGGWLEEEQIDVLPSTAMAALRGTASAHAPIVVLTEGRTDVAILQAALDLIYPDLRDVVRFLDHTGKPESGAAAQVRSVKAFAAAGIANRVVAIFDNDAAARDALRALDPASLPDHIAVLHYPDIELARAYPTIGPPTSEQSEGRIESADVNGLAGSIEMYLGVDVLTREDGTLTPVQWKSFIQGVRSYQGEVLDKDALHRRFEAKVQRSRSGLDVEEWSDLRSILDSILQAFLDRPVPDGLCTHGGRSQTEVRVRPLQVDP